MNPGPMLYPQFIKILRGSLLRAGRSQGETACRTYNALRRFLPTAAQAFQLPPEEAQAVENWVDIPQSAAIGTARRQKLVATDPMGLHYAGFTEHRSIAVKLEVFRRLWFLRQQRSPPFLGLLEPGSWSWPAVYQEAVAHQLLGSTSQAAPNPRKRKLISISSPVASSGTTATETKTKSARKRGGS